MVRRNRSPVVEPHYRERGSDQIAHSDVRFAGQVVSSEFVVARGTFAN